MKVHNILLLIAYLILPIQLFGETQLSSQDRFIRSIDMNQNRVCWVDQNYKLDCIGRSDFAQSSVPITVNDPQLISLGVQFSCASEANGDVKCWDNISGMGYTVPKVKSPKKLFIDNKIDRVWFRDHAHRFSCGLLLDNKVKCWFNRDKARGFRLFQDNFINSFVLSDVKTMAVSFGHACALLNTGKLRCWNKDGFYSLHSADRVYKDVSEFVIYRSQTCLVVANETSCFNLKDLSKENDSKLFNNLEVAKIKHLKRMKFVRTSINDVSLDDGRKRLGLLCGVSHGYIECYSLKDNNMYTRLFVGNEMKDYETRIIYNDPALVVLCAYMNNESLKCDPKNKGVKNFEKYKKSISESMNEKYIQKKQLDLPTSKGQVESVYITDLQTCALIAGEPKCWGRQRSSSKYVYDVNRIEHRSPGRIRYENSKVDLVKARLVKQNSSEKFVIKGYSDNCYIKGFNVICSEFVSELEKKRYSSKGEIISASKLARYKIKFKSRPFYIKQFTHELRYSPAHRYRYPIKVCAVSNTEFKCWNLNKIKYYRDVKQFYEESFDGPEKICNSYYDNTILDEDGDESGGARWSCMPVQDEFDNAFFKESKSVYSFDTFNRYCDYSNFEQLESLDCKTSAWSHSRKNVDQLVTDKYKINNLWFMTKNITSIQNYMKMESSENVCISTDDENICGVSDLDIISNHVSLSKKYLKALKAKNFDDLDLLLEKSLVSLPRFYSMLIESLQSVKIPKSNVESPKIFFDIGKEDEIKSRMEDYYLLSHYLYENKAHLFKLIFDDIDSDFFQDQLIPELEELIRNSKPLINIKNLKLRGYNIDLVKYKVQVLNKLLKFVIIIVPASPEEIKNFVRATEKILNNSFDKQSIDEVLKGYENIRPIVLSYYNSEFEIVPQLIEYTVEQIKKVGKR